MVQVQWIGSSQPIDRDRIAGVEDLWGVRFPDDYVNCAMLNHGKYPMPDSFELGEGREAFNILLSYDPNGASYIIQRYHDIRDRFVEKVFPFAADPGGNMICFDYREGSVPVVVFWDHEEAFANPEKAVTPICGSFTEFLGMLQEFEEE